MSRFKHRILSTVVITSWLGKFDFEKEESTEFWLKRMVEKKEDGRVKGSFPPLTLRHLGIFKVSRKGICPEGEMKERC